MNVQMLFTFVYDRKNENHWSLLIRYSLPLLRIQTPLTVVLVVKSKIKQ